MIRKEHGRNGGSSVSDPDARIPRRHVAFTLAGVTAVVLYGPIAQVSRLSLLNDWHLQPYVQRTAYGSDYISMTQALDNVLWGWLTRGLFAAGIPADVVAIAMLVFTGIVLVPAAYSLCRAVVDSEVGALILLPVLLFCTYGQASLARFFGTDASLARMLYWPLYYAPADAGILFAIAAALRRRPWGAAAGIVFATLWHPLMATFAAVCVVAMLAPAMLRAPRHAVPLITMLFVIGGFAGLVARSAYGGDAPIPPGTVKLYHRIFNAHFYPLSVFAWHARSFWGLGVAFLAALAMFPLLARRLACPIRLPLVLGFSACAIVAILGCAATAFDARVPLIFIEAMLPRASAMNSLLFTVVAGAYFLDGWEDRARRMVGGLGLAWMLLAGVTHAGVGAGFGLLACALLVDRTHPWRRTAVASGGAVLVAGGTGALLVAARPDGAWFAAALGAARTFFFDRPLVGWPAFVVVGMLPVAVQGRYRTGPAGARRGDWLAPCCAVGLTLVAAGQLYVRREARFEQHSMDERVRVRDWCQAHLPPDSVVMGGPDLRGVRAMSGRPSLGRPQEWVYAGAMVYKQHAPTLAAGRARLAAFGVRLEDYTTHWPAPPSGLAYRALQADYRDQFRAMPYDELRSLLRAEGADYLILWSGVGGRWNRPVEEQAVVFATDSFRILDLRRSLATTVESVDGREQPEPTWKG